MRRAAFLAWLLAACGSPKSPAADAPISSDVSMSSDDVTPVKAITVNVADVPYGGNQGDKPSPFTGVIVYFTAPDGTISMETTDTAGNATHAAQDGTDVTIVWKITDYRYSIGTYVDVPTDMTMHVFIGTSPGSKPVAGTVNVSLPAMAGAAFYEVRCSCASGYNFSDTVGRAWSVDVRNCDFAHSATVVAIAEGPYDAALGERPPIGYSVVSNIDLPNALGTTITVPPFQPAATISATVSNLPGDVTGLNTWAPENWLSTDTLKYSELYLANRPVSNSAITASLPIVPYGDRTTHALAIQTTNGLVSYWDGSDATNTANVVIDGSQMIRRATALQFDAAAHSVTWADLDPGLPPNMLTTMMHWNTSDGIEVYESFFQRAPSTTSYVFPTLPIEIGAFAQPAANATWIDFERFLFPSKTFEEVVGTMPVGLAGGMYSLRITTPVWRHP